MKGQDTDKAIDIEHRSLLVAGRVRDVIVCGECRKPRCIFALSKLGSPEELEIARVKEDGVFRCGSPLFPDGHPLCDTVVVRQSLRCATTIEATYYGAPYLSFPPVCVHCGQEDDLVLDDSMKELRQQFHTVRPICSSCKDSRKKVATRGPKNVGKKQQK